MTMIVTVDSYVLKFVIICLSLCWLCALRYILIVLQLAVVTEERNKLRNVTNLKNDEALDASINANPVKVALTSIFL